MRTAEGTDDANFTYTIPQVHCTLIGNIFASVAKQYTEAMRYRLFLEKLNIAIVAIIFLDHRQRLFFDYFAHFRADYFGITRSCAALRAADLDWIVGPEYRPGRGAGQE